MTLLHPHALPSNTRSQKLLPGLTSHEATQPMAERLASRPARPRGVCLRRSETAGRELRASSCQTVNTNGGGWDRTRLTPDAPDSTAAHSGAPLQGKDEVSAEGDDRPRPTESNAALGQHADSDESRRSNDLPFIHDGQLSFFDLLGEQD